MFDLKEERKEKGRQRVGRGGVAIGKQQAEQKEETID